MTLTCPHCDNTEQNTIMGHELPSVFNGVLYWACLKCGKAWSRDWSGFGQRGYIAAEEVARHNMGTA